MNAPPASVDPRDEPQTPKPDAQQAGMVAGTVFGTIFLIIFHFGAAKLSYDTYGSMFWAFIDFFFPYIYYPYYAFVLHRPPPPAPLFAGRRRR